MMTVIASAATRIRGCDVDWSLGTVKNGIGAPVTLRPQTLAVLKLLTAKPGMLVSKDELMAVVWPGLAVTDDSLVQCVTEIRKALGDDRHKIVKTVPKRGYVFEPGARIEPESRKQSYFLIGLIAVVAIAALVVYFPRPNAGQAEMYRPGVAVLPFENLSGEARWDRLADGLTEDVTTDLSRFNHLKIVARHSVEKYKGNTDDVREIARTLGVQYVIEGSVQQDGQALRVTAQLIDAASGEHLWSQRWDRPDAGNIALQDEVAASVSGEVGGMFNVGAITKAEIKRTLKKQPGDRSAYDYFLIAVDKKARYTKQATADGLDAINRALAIDPQIARAYLVRAWLHLWATDFGAPWDSEIAAMGADAQKAFDLDPRDADIRAGFGMYLSLVNRLPEAENMMREALAINARDSHIMCIAAMVLPYTGSPGDAAALAKGKMRLEPHAEPSNHGCLVHAYFFSRNFEDAAKIISGMPVESRNTFFRVVYAASLKFLGRDSDAQAAKSAVLESRPNITAQAFYTEGWYFARQEEKHLFFEAFRTLGLPMCATAEQLKTIAKPEPLPECRVFSR